MSNWIAVKHLPLDQDLSELTRFLQRRGLNFRVSEESGRQVIAVQDPQLVEPLDQLIDDFLRGELPLRIGLRRRSDELTLLDIRHRELTHRRYRRSAGR